MITEITEMANSLINKLKSIEQAFSNLSSACVNTNLNNWVYVCSPAGHLELMQLYD